VLIVTAASAGCGGPLRVAAVGDMERARSGAAVRQAATAAPDVYANAERERALAIGAHAGGDDVGATLHAEHAIAGYEHALEVARMASASIELIDATRTADDAAAQAQALEASRVQLEKEATDLEKRVEIARDRLFPARSTPTSPDREAARLTEARALAVEARLLCGAARLIAPAADGLAQAGAALTSLVDRMDRDIHPAPIDEAASVRVRCLDVLTRARRSRADEADHEDALLAELSASGGWDPTRDERGVLVTLRGAYTGLGTRLTDDATAKLKDLGRVAAAHPGFGVQVVVHDALATSTKDDRDAQRAASAVQALMTGGALAKAIDSELARAQAPVTDPNDAHERARNERLEIVFVGP
jgi:flagellar motor protein MotB